MQICCMWDQGFEVDLLVHTKSCQSCACHRAVGAATNYSVVPLGGVAFNAHDAMQFSREELVTNIADI